MCSSDSKNKRICQTLTTASVSCVMYSGRVPSSSWEFLFTLFCSFSHSSLKTKTFMTTPFTNAHASTNLPNVQKVRLVPEQSLERSVTAFSDGELCGLPILIGCNSFFLFLLWEFGGAKTSVHGFSLKDIIFGDLKLA